MEWLTLLVGHPAALASFLQDLKDREQQCSAYALDIPVAEIPALKGKRDAFRDLLSYVQNNVVLAQRGLNSASNGPSGQQRDIASMQNIPFPHRGA